MLKTLQEHWPIVRTVIVWTFACVALWLVLNRIHEVETSVDHAARLLAEIKQAQAKGFGEANDYLNRIKRELEDKR
jgi:hypothetical protein